ncbi:hypothetical protein RYA05_02710 [Pseudomonas syringae pv. actinidiae]|nr:hypothetical protein [Pseudomonas syringae pv. actinidiae]
MRNVLIDAKMGESTQQPDSKWAVEFWYLPGGYDVANARACVVYFNDEEMATYFESRYKNREEMAFKYKLPEVKEREATATAA